MWSGYPRRQITLAGRSTESMGQTTPTAIAKIAIATFFLFQSFNSSSSSSLISSKSLEFDMLMKNADRRSKNPITISFLNPKLGVQALPLRRRHCYPITVRIGRKDPHMAIAMEWRLPRRKNVGACLGPGSQKVRIRRQHRCRSQLSSQQLRHRICLAATRLP